MAQYPGKSILMDIVVDDIPPKYGMLLSRPWGAKLQGYLQLDMSYATISVSGQPDRKSTRLNSSHLTASRMPSSA